MATGRRRYLDSNGFAYACELGRLAHQLVEASNGALLRRIECIYEEILIDEVQDLTPMQLKMATRRSLNGAMTIVGDIAQATGPLAPDRWATGTAHAAPAPH